MLKIDLPETYENKIVLTQVEVQKKTMKEFEQNATLIRAQMQVDISDANRTIANISAFGQSHGYLIKQQAQANAMNNIITAESTVYKTAMNMIGLSQQEMMTYISYLFVLSSRNATLLFGVNQGIINIAH